MFKSLPWPPRLNSASIYSEGAAETVAQSRATGVLLVQGSRDADVQIKLCGKKDWRSWRWRLVVWQQITLKIVCGVWRSFVFRKQ